MKKSLLFSLSFILFLNIGLYAQVAEREISNFTPKKLTQFAVSPSFETVLDSEAGMPNQMDLNPYCYIKLYIDNNLAPFEWYEVKAKFQISPLNSDLSIDTTNILEEVELKVNYNPYSSNTVGGNFNDLSYFKIENRYGLNVSLIPGSIVATKLDGTSTSLSPENAYVEMGFKVTRYYLVSQQNVAISNNIINYTNIQGNPTPGVLKLEWSELTGALEYDLEWTWIDGYSENGVNDFLPSNQISLTEREFELNSTRISTSQNEYEIPLIYSKGYLIYRIRGKSRFPNNHNVIYYGNWSSGTNLKSKISDWPNVVSIGSEHEKNKNWQFQASYAEDGKKKEVVSYFDGSLRNRQTVTKVNSDDNAIIGEVIYDTQGRAAIEILPVPTNENKIKFYNNFNLNNSSQLFSHNDFDWDKETNGENICETEFSLMNPLFGSSRYYSTNNDFLSRKNHNFIPDAKGFPYSQIEYTPDNTGRIARKGGVGETHRLDSGHEMKYFYTKPSSEELNRLFGYSVGNVIHYKKNIVVDPNGQISVSYIDPQGRTIATGLAGNTPTNDDDSPRLDGLADSATNATTINSLGDSEAIHSSFFTDLLNKASINDVDTNNDNNFVFSTGNYLLNDGLRYFGTQFNSQKNTDFNFKYKLQGKNAFAIDCGDTTIGYPFVYKLEIDALNDCGESILEDGKITSSIQLEPTKLTANVENCPKEYNEEGQIINQSSEVELYNLLSVGSNPIVFKDIAFGTVSLDVGTYNINKEIIVDADILEKYADDYINRLKVNGCLICPDALSPEAAFADCFQTCDECVASLGTESSYVQAHLDLHSDNTPEELVLLQEKYEREYELLVIECRRPCQQDGISIGNSNSENTQLSCTTKEGRLLADVSPSGQYGYFSNDSDTNGSIITLENDPLSIYNVNNGLFTNYVSSLQTTIGNSYTTTPYSWRTPYNVDFPSNPKHYYDEIGSIFYVDVQQVGTDPTTGNPIYSPQIVNGAPILNSTVSGFIKVEPQYLLKVEDFVANFEQSWAKSLVIYHPEYAYLNYEKEVCSLVKQISIKKDNEIINYSLSSDGFTNMLKSLTFNEAFDVNNNFVNSSGFSSLNIVQHDPYFSFPLAIESGNSAFFLNKRIQIIQEAMNSNYNGSGNSAFILALRGLYCNNLSSCTINNDTPANVIQDIINSLTIEQRDDLWFRYVAFYISVKQTIHSVFANIYAKNNGVYNGCISNANVPANILSPLSVYTGVSSLNSYIVQPAQYLCNSTSSLNYDEKEKIFLPSDALYNSGQSNAQNLADMTQFAQYYNYVNTGVCPKASQLEYFLVELVKQQVNNNPVNIANSTICNYQGAYLNPDLILQANTNYLIPNPSPSQIQIRSSISSNILSISVADDTQSAVIANLIGNSDYPWSSHNVDWRVLEFSRLTYTTLIQGTYNFTILAKIKDIQNNKIKEIVLQGYTLAKIGECTINGNNNGIGDDLGNGSGMPSNITNCNKENDFEKGIKELINYLINHNLINNVNVNLLDYALVPVFNDGSLKDFILKDINSINSNSIIINEAIWNKTASGFELVVNNSFVYKVDINIPNVLNYNFDSIDVVINTASSLSGNYLINFSESGVGTLFTGTLFRENEVLSFSCCEITTSTIDNQSIIQDWLKSFLTEVFQNFNGQNNYTTTIVSSNLNELASYITGVNVLNSNIFAQIEYSNPNYISVNIFQNKFFVCKLYIPLNGIKIDSVISIDMVNFISSNHIEIFYTEYYGDVKKINIETDCKFMLKSETFNEICDFGCIPQVVAPVSCTDKYILYIDAMETRFGLIDYGQTVNEEHFCNMNYAYITDGYIDYLNTFILTNDSSGFESPYYISIDEFGATPLNYGYNSYDLVIDSYDAFNSSGGNDNEDEFVNWSAFVSIYLSMSENLGICPPKPLIRNLNLEIEDPNPDCIEFQIGISEAYNNESYQAMINAKKEAFKNAYLAEAITNLIENFEVEYADKEYQYTLYYYDQAGNLTQTVAPEGVKRFTPSEIALKNDLINQYKLNNGPLTNPVDDISLQPNHELKTQYRYNSLNQLVWQTTPDGGETRFAYDKLGRIIASQNAKQAGPGAFDGPKAMSYTVYDELGRITEAGQVNGISRLPSSSTYSYFISDEGRLVKATRVLVPNPFGGGSSYENNEVLVDGFDDTLPKTEVTRTVYDEFPEVEPTKFASDYFVTLEGTTLQDRLFNTRNRVTGVFYYDDFSHLNPLQFDNAIFYNYDVHGNVKEQVTYYMPLRDSGCRQVYLDDAETILNDCESHLKRVKYDYDLISGNVNEVTFQPNFKNLPLKADHFKHKYVYDADNRIVSVATSSDGVIWEKDAKYEYYAHGPLSRVEIGNKMVQGVDYAYTLQGWLKAVNGENLASPNNDMGQDGTISNKLKTKDAFGYSLNYFDGDYKAIDTNDDGTSTFNPLMISRNAIGVTNRNLYNGNIKQMTTAIRKNSEELLDIQKNNYTYDQLNRITGMSSVAIVPTASGIGSHKTSISSNYSYDRNGNLQALTRTAFENTTSNAPVTIDNLAYKYNTGNNQLTKVFDSADDIFGPNVDLKKNSAELASYDVSNPYTHNYIYDEIGQLIEDKSENLAIEWRVDGKVNKVIKYNGALIIEFVYDGLGNRIAKREYKTGRGSNGIVNSTYYARDAQGNVLGVYKINQTNKIKGANQSSLTLVEHHLYGSSRLGMEEKEIVVYQNEGCPTCRLGEPNVAFNENQIFNENQLTGGSLSLNENNAFTWPGHTVYATSNPNNSVAKLLDKASIRTKFTINNVPTPQPSQVSKVFLSEVQELRQVKYSSGGMGNGQLIGINGNSPNNQRGDVFNLYTFKTSVLKNEFDQYAIEVEISNKKRVAITQGNLPTQLATNGFSANETEEITRLQSDFNIDQNTISQLDQGVELVINYTEQNRTFVINGNEIVPNVVYENTTTNTSGVTLDGAIGVTNKIGGINSDSSDAGVERQVAMCLFDYTFNDASTSNNQDDIIGTFAFTGSNQSLAGNLVKSNQNTNNNFTLGLTYINENTLTGLPVGSTPINMSPFDNTAVISFTFGACPVDSDGDGIYDIYEFTNNGNGTYTMLDTDGDGIPNASWKHTNKHESV
jgi:YD repeat-containing protein